MKTLRYGVIGCGFWSRFQIAAWQEVGGVELVGLYNRTRDKAVRLAEEFGGRVYDTARDLLASGSLDFVDIITNVETHAAYTMMAARHKVPVICQKPMAPSRAACRHMVAACARAGVPLFIHDNWRWQAPVRAVHAALRQGVIGRPFRARITYANSFPVFVNQPFLAELEQFIVMDMGTHILDVVRCLFGEAHAVYCRTASITRGIKGDDVATLLLAMCNGLHCTVELSYASPVEHDRFPEVYMMIEGERGALALGPDYYLHTTVDGATTRRRVPPPQYAWADPAYALVHASIVEANRDFLRALRGRGRAETTGADYRKTMELVFAAYDSARRNAVVKV